MNFDSFSHGQIQSKLWLCEKLEEYLLDRIDIVILASWYNVLGFMLAIRNPNKFKSIHGIDINPEAIIVANKLCNAWTLGSTAITNECGDVNLGFPKSDVVINCSPEHIQGDAWFTNVAPGTLVCIQSSNVDNPNWPWLVKTPTTSINQIREKFPLSTTHFCDTLRIRYQDWGYDRYMLIGVK